VWKKNQELGNEMRGTCKSKKKKVKTGRTTKKKKRKSKQTCKKVEQHKKNAIRGKKNKKSGAHESLCKKQEPLRVGRDVTNRQQNLRKKRHVAGRGEFASCRVLRAYKGKGAKMNSTTSTREREDALWTKRGGGEEGFFDAEKELDWRMKGKEMMGEEGKSGLRWTKQGSYWHCSAIRKKEKNNRVRAGLKGPTTTKIADQKRPLSAADGGAEGVGGFREG